jgi:hypothetical protein
MPPLRLSIHQQNVACGTDFDADSTAVAAFVHTKQAIQTVHKAGK